MPAWALPLATALVARGLHLSPQDEWVLPRLKAKLGLKGAVWEALQRDGTPLLGTPGSSTGHLCRAKRQAFGAPLGADIPGDL